MKKIEQINGSKKITKDAQKKVNGGFPVYLCEPGKVGQACIATDGQIGQCNSLGICEC